MSPLPQKASLGVEDLYAPIPRVSHIDLTRRAHRNPPRVRELTIAGGKRTLTIWILARHQWVPRKLAPASKGESEGAVHIQDDDTIVAAVDDDPCPIGG